MHPTLTRTLRWFGLLEAGRRVELKLRRGESRSLPDAMILGAMKAGTTSLHFYLTQHPRVIAPLRKEIHYFDVNYARGEAWYRANFGRVDEPGLNLDSSPYYLFHPCAPERAHSLVPDAKLIVLLRDPVRRAYSQYWHQRDKGREKLSFEDAIAAEADRLGDDEARLARGEITHSAAHQHFSYLARGRYAEQLERWFAVYPTERMLVLRFEDFSRAPLVGLNEALEFLGLPALRDAMLEPRNAGRYEPMKAATEARLRKDFAPHNARLEALLGRSFGW